MQTIAIVAAGMWALGYVFFYSDFYKVINRPAHVTPTIKIHTDRPVDGYIPVTAEMEVENESKRDVYLLPAVFIAVGSKLKPIDKSNADFIKYINKESNEDDDFIVNRFVSSNDVQILAGGTVFHDVVLSPDESISKSYVFYVPEKTYQTVEVAFNFWGHKGKKELWSIISFKGIDEFKNIPCEVVSKKPWKCTPIYNSENNRKLFEELDLWEFESRKQVSLN